MAETIIKIMKKILISLSTIALVASVSFVATRAFFTSSATSTGNTFTAGTLNLQLSKDSTFVSAADNLFTISNMAPGDTAGPSTLYFKNTGTITGKIGIALGIAPTGSTTVATSTDFAKHLFVTSSIIAQPGTSTPFEVSPAWANHIIAFVYASSTSSALSAGAVYDSGSAIYKPTLYGLTLMHQYFDNGSSQPVAWTGGATGSIAMTIQFDTASTNALQGAGLTATLTSNMRQFTDPIAENDPNF